MNISRYKCQSEPCPETLVLLHGWGSNSAIWKPWLASLTNDFNVTCIDLPSGENVEKLSLDAVLSLIESAIDEEVVLVGWSLGGMLATLLANRGNISIKAAVLVASNPCFVQSEDWSLGMSKIDFDLFLNNFEQQPTKTLKRFNLLQVAGDTESKQVLKKINDVDLQLNHVSLLQYLHFLKMDVRQILRDLQIPSLHFYGEQDLLVPCSIAPEIQALSPYTNVSVIPNTAHLPFIFHGELMTQGILKFLEKRNLLL